MTKEITTKPTPTEATDPTTADADELSDLTLPRPERLRLPDVRQSITHKFLVGEQEGYLIVGLYKDGSPGELFIKASKQGSTLSGLLDTIGILTSLCLQYGVPVEALARKLEYMRFEPAGWTTNDQIRRAHSITDYIFRWLGLRFSETYAKEQGDFPSQDEEQHEE